MTLIHHINRVVDGWVFEVSCNRSKLSIRIVQSDLSFVKKTLYVVGTATQRLGQQTADTYM